MTTSEERRHLIVRSWQRAGMVAWLRDLEDVLHVMCGTTRDAVKMGQVPSAFRVVVTWPRAPMNVPLPPITARTCGRPAGISCVPWA